MATKWIVTIEGIGGTMQFAFRADAPRSACRALAEQIVNPKLWRVVDIRAAQENTNADS